jgi:hypothetical protein
MTSLLSLLVRRPYPGWGLLPVHHPAHLQSHNAFAVGERLRNFDHVLRMPRYSLTPFFLTVLKIRHVNLMSHGNDTSGKDSFGN